MVFLVELSWPVRPPLAVIDFPLPFVKKLITHHANWVEFGYSAPEGRGWGRKMTGWAQPPIEKRHTPTYTGVTKLRLITTAKAHNISSL